jgi:hypothetical protein
MRRGHRGRERKGAEEGDEEEDACCWFLTSSTDRKKKDDGHAKNLNGPHAPSVDLSSGQKGEIQKI